MLTKEEKLEVFNQDRSVGSTYADHAAPTPGGRFASHQPSPTVIKSGHDYPRQPVGSPWRSDPVPDLLPLGQDINEMPQEQGCGPEERGDYPSPDPAAEPTPNLPPAIFKRRV